MNLSVAVLVGVLKLHLSMELGMFYRNLKKPRAIFRARAPGTFIRV